MADTSTQSTFTPKGPNEPVVNLPLTFPPPMARASSPSAQLAPPATVNPPTLNPGPSVPLTPQVVKQTFGPSSLLTNYSDGTSHLDYYVVPVSRHLGTSWSQVDPTVNPSNLAAQPLSAEGALRPVRFGNSSSQIVQLELDGGPVTMSASGLTVGAPTLQGGEVVYSNVATNTDLTYQVGYGGVKEQLILNSAAAPHQFSFHLSDPAGQLGAVHLQADGSYRFDARIDSSVAIGLAPAVAYLQSDPSAVAQNLPGTAHMTVVKAGDGYDLTVSVDETWLQGKTYPIVLDPTLTFTDTNGLMAAYTDYNTTNGPGTNTPQTGNDLWAGTSTTYAPSRTFMYFNLASIPTGSLITYATLNMNVASCVALGATCAAQSTYNLDLHRLIGSWTSATTWNQLSALTATGPFASISESGSRIASATSASTFWETWEISQQVQRWVNGTANGGDANNGFEAQIRNEAPNIGGPYWCYQRTTFCVNQSAHPFLSVAYATPTSVTGDQSATVNWSLSGQPSYATGYTVTSNDTTTGLVGPTVTVPGSPITATLNGLTNTHTYALSITGNFFWTPGGTYPNPGAVPVPAGMVTLPVELTSSTDASGGQASAGQQVTYKLVVSNDTTAALPVTSITDLLPASFQASAGGVQIDGSACTTAPTCSLSNGTLSIGSFSLAAKSSRTFTYFGLELGTARGCLATTNAVSAVNANGTSHASSPLLVCDGGLGAATWWSYLTRSLGPGGTAAVNVADGNLVVSQADSTPIQAHGKLTFALKRVYNSQDTGNLPIAASIGTGWRLMAGVEGPIALYVPPPTTQVPNPIAVSVLDSAGLRSIFQPRGGTFTSVDVTSRALTGVLAALNPRAMAALDAGYTNLCVDTTYAPPIGVHMGLWRYIEVNGSCTSSGATKVFGFAAMRLDRMRFEFSADGRLLDTSDGAGNELLYVYDGTNHLLTVSEPRCVAPNKCRSFSFTYPTNETDVTDPAGRVTKYKFTGALLTQVVNPDTSTLNYTYGVGNCTGASASQLCSASDPNGGLTKFTYTQSYVAGGQPRVATVVDRNNNQTTLTYTNTASPEYVTADVSVGAHRTRYMTIDSLGRITEIDQGDTSNNFLRQSYSTWDITGQSCRQPDNVMDNNLCNLVRRTTPGTAAVTDESTAFVYNSEGRVIEQAKTISSGLAASTTSGYQAEYFEASGPARVLKDTVSGNGAVGSGTGVRADSQTLFYVSDQTDLLSPRGNASGANVPAFTTHYVVDYTATVAPANRPSASVCPSSGTNTGLVCEVDGPYYDGTHSAITKYAYDAYGQKTSMTTPKVNAGAGNPYTYTYYDDATTDLSGTVSAGGWLKATTDPLGNFAVLAYDAAGNVTKTWDRNSTKGTTLASYPSGTGLPATYMQDSYTGSVLWRYLLSHRDQLGNTTTYTVDKNGNRLAIRPPLGNLAGNNTYDVTQLFDANDNLLKQTTPAELGNPVVYTYDSNNNLVEKQDQLGKITVNFYDSVNRLISTRWTRAVWNATTAPAGCRQSTSSDAPLPSGDILCFTSTAYDGTDNVISSTDGNGQTTTISYDSNHEERTRQIPRNSGGTTTVRSDHVYDLDGNLLDTCSPRQFSPTEGNSSTCTSSGYYSTHQAWDTSGRLSTVTTYRVVGGIANVATYTYDADGNPATYTDPNGHVTTYTYDLLGQKLTETRTGQGGLYTVGYTYDSNGNQTSVTKPITSTTAQITAYSYDAANRLIDTVQASSNVDATLAGGPDSAGGINIRTRQAYDADGNIVATFPPDAFAVGWTPGTLPDARFMIRIDYDVDGRMSAQYTPRFDSTTHTDLGGTYGSTTQNTQCWTTQTTQPTTIPGIPGYPADVGICYKQMFYDAKGQLVKEYEPTYNGGNTGRYLTYTYTDDGKPASLQGPDPSVTTSPAPQETIYTYLYDGIGNLVKTTNQLGFQATTGYTGDNLVQQQTSQPAGSNTHQVTYSLDANGNQTNQQDQSNQQIRHDYYTDDSLRDWVDAAGNETYYARDATGNITAVYPPAINLTPFDANNSGGTPIITTFTSDNLPAQVIEPVRPNGTLRRTTTYTYDLMGRRTVTQVQLANYTSGGLGGSFSSWNGSASSQSVTYLPDDRVSVQTGRNNETITDTYDPAGNVLSAVDSGNNTSTTTATFYLDSLPRTVDDGVVTSQYAYDASGSVSAKAQVLDGIAPPNNSYAHLYTYNDAGLLSSLTSSLMAAGGISWFYDHNGRVNEEHFANGEKASWTWNNDDTLASAAHTNVHGQAVGTYTYAYDSTRRVLSQALTNTGTAADGTFSYQYDAASRLISVTDTNNLQQTITWDHDGNRLTYGTQTFTYNADDSILANGSLAYSYNAPGQVISDGCKNYAYDGFDRLSQVSAAGSCNLTTINYQYDAFDRQISRGWTSSTTSFHYDGFSQQTVLERTTGVADTVYDTHTDGSSVAVNQSSLPVNTANTQYILEDGHNNAAFITNASSTTICVARFDPWGAPYGSGTSFAQPCTGGVGTINKHFYRQGRLDESTGDYQLGSRTYVPLTASFLEPDTYRIGTAAVTLSVTTDPLTRNRYGYVNGDPVNNFDPSGHVAEGGDNGGCGGSGEAACQAVYAPAVARHHTSSPNFFQSIGNAWNAAAQVRNIRPDAGGAQDNLIALSKHMDSGWKDRYKGAIQGAGDWTGGETADLSSGDPYRVMRGTSGAVMFAAYLVPGAGGGAAAVEDLGRVALSEAVDHAPQIENILKDAAPEAKNALEGGGTTIYRGIAEDHFRFPEATDGVAMPGDPLGHADAFIHNGGFTETSRLTSWSTDQGVAEKYAGPGGIVLHTTTEELQAQGINMLRSPDTFNEAEVLVEGAVNGLGGYWK